MAKTETTVKGYVYTVTSPNGGTVTDAEGKLNKTVDAGDQVTVTAPSDSITCDDDDAVICKANFKSAALALGLLGGGKNDLPAGYTRLEFIETPSHGSAFLQLGVEYFDILEIDITPTKLENRDYFAQAAQAGKYRQSIESYSGYYAVCYGRNYSREHRSSVAVVAGERVKILMDSVKQTLTINGTLRTTANLFDVGTASAQALRVPYFASLRLHGMTVTTNDITSKLIPALDPNGKPCMYDLASKTAFKNRGSGQFIAGLTISQVRGLRLPAGGGKLTLSLPHEASIDRLAQAALERARANGWELTLQYAEADVPAGYRRLEFLESTGSQWIDTGFTPKMGDELSIEVSFKNVNEIASTLFSSGNDTSQLVGVALYRSEYLPAGFTSFYIRYFSDYSPNFVLPTNTKAKIKISSTGECFLNEKVQFVNQPIGEVNTSLLLCKRVAPTSANYFIGRIYSFSITRAGVAQVDYVPCISPNGALGMYNKVDGTMKENAGSGAFIAGLASVDDVRKLWLPETGGELTVSVPADTPDSAVEQLRKNNPNWQIAIQIRTDNEN